MDIEICVPSGNDLNSVEYMLSILKENTDLADRFGIYVDEQSESVAAFIILWSFLRPEHEELGKLADEKLQYLKSHGQAEGSE